MDLLLVRDELAEAVRAATALLVYELPTGQLSAPAVLMGAPSGRYDETTDGAMVVEWPLIAIVTRSHPDALSELAAMVGTTDQRSIANAIKIYFSDGTSTDKVTFEFPLGHRRRRTEAISCLMEKFQDNLETRFDGDQRAKILEICADFNLLQKMSVRDFMDLFITR